MERERHRSYQTNTSSLVALKPEHGERKSLLEKWLESVSSQRAARLMGRRSLPSTVSGAERRKFSARSGSGESHVVALVRRGGGLGKVRRLPRKSQTPRHRAAGVGGESVDLQWVRQ